MLILTSTLIYLTFELSSKNEQVSSASTSKAQSNLDKDDEDLSTDEISNFLMRSPRRSGYCPDTILQYIETAPSIRIRYLLLQFLDGLHLIIDGGDQLLLVLVGASG